MTAVWIVVGLVAAAAIALALAYAFLTREPSGGEGAEITGLVNDTTTDPSGAVRSVQSADLYMPPERLEQLWSPSNLERVARTYWRFLSRITLGLIRVVYSEHERHIVLLLWPVRLITFRAPAYEMDEERGLVRWRIERGLLVARGGRGRGYLQIDLRRSPGDRPGRARLRVEVEVANFYPSIASGISRRVYNATQSRVHVMVTYAFLRSLARLHLAQSRVGRLSTVAAIASPRRHHPVRGPRS